MDIAKGLYDQLVSFGINKESVRAFHGDDLDPETLIEYQDLLQDEHMRRAISAVVESNNQPILYIVRSDNLVNLGKDNQGELIRLRRKLACRGHLAYLGVIDAGKITIFPCNLGQARSSKSKSQVTIIDRDPQAASLMQDLVQGFNPLEMGEDLRAKPSEVHRVLIKLLNSVVERLIKSNAFKQHSRTDKMDEILSLVGRVLFVRFLIDRGVLTAESLGLDDKESLDTLFDRAESAALAFEWLDINFNDSLLKLAAPDRNYVKYFEEKAMFDKDFMAPLKWIMRREPNGIVRLWEYINFAHVPVGLLSEVYESLARKYFSFRAKVESIHYTPRHIAELVVNQVFTGLKDPLKVKVLDPAVGAGVFLVIVFKKLVLEHWRKTGIRPDSEKIREILYSQLHGFDINSHALILSALSLYLTAIELDPDPKPSKKLKFEKNLIGTVLLDVASGQYPYLGTLGEGVPEKFNGQYDIVLGNPPWTTWSAKKDNSKKEILNKYANKIVERVIESRKELLGKVEADYGEYSNPDGVPDLPFIFKSIELCKPNGIIALIVHSRILFTQRGPMKKARSVLLKNLRITGILNGSLLTDNGPIWPDVSAPFSIIFAINRVPKEKEFFRFISPYNEKGINKQGRIRVDPNQASLISFENALSVPYVFKVLTRGTSLDLRVMNHIFSRLQDDKFLSINDYWERHSLSKGEGYINNGRTSAEHLIDLRGFDYNANVDMGFVIQTGFLPRFNRSFVERPRKAEQYLPPLVLVSESPGDTRYSIRSRIYKDETPLIYTKSFFGLSCHNHPQAQDLAKYIFLLMNSDLFLYFQLMVSAKFGVERRAIISLDIGSLPILIFENLTDYQKQRIGLLFEEITKLDNFVNRNALNQFVFDLYDFSDTHRQIIDDTLSVGLPYKKYLNEASREPSEAEVLQFCKLIEDNISPMTSLVDGPVKVLPVSQEEVRSESWRFFDIRSESAFHSLASEMDNTLLKIGESLAEMEGASHIALHISSEHLRFGLLSRYRYWTKSRAILFSQESLKLWRENRKNMELV